MDHFHQHDHIDLEDTDPSNVFRFKIESLLLIFITALAGGLVPLRLRVSHRLLSLGNTFSGGVFLAAGFAHMLPEAVEGFEHLELNQGFPIPYVLCIVGLLLALFLERLFPHTHSHSSSPADHDSEQKHAANANAYILALMLSLHSLIEGLALGVEDSLADIRNTLFAIVGHKLFDSFAFGISLAKLNHDSATLMRAICLFSCVTPLGILLGLNMLADGGRGGLADAVKAVSAGTFIYIGLVEVLIKELQDRRDSVWKFTVLTIGLTAMCVLSSGSHAH